jgi:hypothetical protein
MKMEVIEKVSSATIFKLLFLGQLITYLGLVLVLMLLVLVDVLPVIPGSEEVPSSLSLGAIGIYFGVGILFLPVSVVGVWLSTIPGLWLWSKFKPITVSFEPVSNE